ncbi:uncharacterized protein LOC100126138 precursor [Danio rerio]|uniref:Uncharacterized protein LOC100126138 precursor n=1 Tax=Danio rerio TaxID=7955 RepID=A0A8N7UZ82_DANRE|nr:uncharacterized protein LOC100126138 precursor [Danio rerio]|eukprot:NP_001138280.2 uncharacterized protein LOC100126138 precursor [Danio rerio]
MFLLSLFLTMILLNSSLLISAGRGGHDGGHDGHSHGGHNGHSHGGHDGHSHGGHGGHDGHYHGGHDHDGHDNDYCRRSTDTKTACEGSVLHLSCPDHFKIKILAANYGRTDRTTCVDYHPWREIKKTDCYSYHCLTDVSARCDGRKSCSIPATNGEFSDPCYGTYKYLRVKYCCKRPRS